MNKSKRDQLTEVISHLLDQRLLEFDPGDLDLQQSANADKSIQRIDASLDALRSFAKLLRRKEGRDSAHILEEMSKSLDSFAFKVMQAVKRGKL